MPCCARWPRHNQPGVSTGPALAAVTSLGYLGFLGGPPLIGGVAQLTSLRLACGIMVFAGLLVVLLARSAAVPGEDPARPDEIWAYGLRNP
jgi:hypothetical protein